MYKDKALACALCSWRESEIMSSVTWFLGMVGTGKAVQENKLRLNDFGGAIARPNTISQFNSIQFNSNGLCIVLAAAR